MRRTLIWFLMATALLLLPVAAAALTPINATTFPDANFRAAVLASYSDGSGNVDESVTFINVNGKSITDLSGIEYFPALTQLYCANNLLASLDISSNTVLTLLACGTNAISVLDLSHNPLLNTLSCTENNLTTLDLSYTTELITFLCGYNQMSSLDLSGQTRLLTTTVGPQYPPSLTYSQSGGTYQVDLTKLPYGNLINMAFVDMKDGGLLNTSTGIVTYASLPSTVSYEYYTQNSGGGHRFMVVNINATAPVPNPTPPQTGDTLGNNIWRFPLVIIVSISILFILIQKRNEGYSR